MSVLLKVGLIGTGVGLRTHYPAFDSTDSVEFVGVVGSSSERAYDLTRGLKFKNVFGSYRDLIESNDVDLVCITSPNKFHYDELMYAINHDKHILCEKPLVSTLEQTIAIARRSANSQKLNLVNHQLRFNPYIRKVRELLVDGRIGRPYFVRIHQQSTGFSDRQAKWSWSFDESMGGGVRLAMGSHLIDLVNFWFDSPAPLLVKGSLDAVVSEREDLQGQKRKVRASSFFSADISFPYLSVQLSATAAALGAARFDFSIFGTDGELHFDLFNKLSGSFLDSRGQVSTIDVVGVPEAERANKVSIFSGSFPYFADRIVRYFSGDGDSLVEASSFDDAIYTQEILDAILDSSLSGESIKLNDGYFTNSAL